MLYILECFLTIFIASRVDLMYENVTGVALMAEYHRLVIVFTIFSACFFAIKTHKVFHQLYSKHKIIHFIINITAIVMSLGALCPYTINSSDLLSQLHVYCSMLGCLSFLVLLFIYTRYLLYDYPIIYQRIHWFYDGGIQFLAILTIVFTRVNGYIEILFAFLVSGYLFLIEYNMKKSI